MENTIQKINSVNIRVPIVTLKSEKDGLTEKAYEALNKDKFPNITFRNHGYNNDSFWKTRCMVL